MEIFLHIGLAEADDALDEMREHGLAVSYTHLTLPTN